MSILRYDCTTYCDGGVMNEAADGEFVKHADCLALEMVIDKLRSRLAEIESLRQDAERWRKFESDCGQDHGEIINYVRYPRPRPPQFAAWGPMSMPTIYMVDDIVPLRQIMYRWLDIDGKRRTVREMIDAQLEEAKNPGQATFAAHPWEAL